MDMKQQNKYYTPDISELHVGYCNYQVCYKKDIWTDAVPIVDGTQVDNVIDLLTGKVGFDSGSHVRTKYLDKKDIESCGWTDVKDVERWMGRPPMYTWSARKDNAMMGYNSEDHTIVIDVADPTKTVDGKKDEYNFPEIKYGRFRGECKSINELRKIMQWLNIK